MNRTTFDDEIGDCPVNYRDVEEFVCVWFHRGDGGWHVILDNTALFGPFPSVGHAKNAALRVTKRAEAEFTCDEDTGCFYRFIKDDEWWSVKEGGQLDTETKPPVEHPEGWDPIELGA